MWKIWSCFVGSSETGYESGERSSTVASCLNVRQSDSYINGVLAKGDNIAEGLRKHPMAIPKDNLVTDIKGLPPLDQDISVALGRSSPVPQQSYFAMATDQSVQFDGGGEDGVPFRTHCYAAQSAQFDGGGTDVVHVGRLYDDDRSAQFDGGGASVGLTPVLGLLEDGRKEEVLELHLEQISPTDVRGVAMLSACGLEATSGSCG